MEKKIRAIQQLAEKLKALPHLDESERLLYAQGLLMTPDECWARNLAHNRLVNSLRPSMRKRFVS